MTLVDALSPFANPEFRRNLWTEFSTHRLIAMPMLLGLLFLGANAVLADSGVDHAAQGALFALLVIWGGRQTGGAVIDEVIGGTWDSQRMSAISPWSLTWGKLFGATAYTWYGAAFCVLALLAAGLTGPGDIVIMLLTGLIAQASALFVGILLQRGQRPTALLGTITLAQVCAIGVALVLMTYGSVWSGDNLLWWGWAIPGPPFVLASEGAALVWVVAGIHALMRDELRYRPQPWTWILFLLFAAGYTAGFADPAHASRLYGSLIAVEVVPLTTAYGTVVFLTLWAAVVSANDSMTLRRWLAAPTAARKRPIALILEAPAWTIGLVLSILLAVALTGAWSAVPLPSWLPVLVWSCTLFLIRDLGVVLTVALDGDRRRGTLGAILYLATLYVLVPLVLQEWVPGIGMAVRPTAGATITGSLLPALGQALIAAALVTWRWRRAGRGLSARTAS